MTSWMGNQIANLCNFVSAPVAATQGALAERLQSIRENASLLYNRMMYKMEHGKERLKGIVEKEGRKEEEKGETIENLYLTAT